MWADSVEVQDKVLSIVMLLQVVELRYYGFLDEVAVSDLET
jgi:hypothetical protein